MDAREKLNEFAELQGWDKNKLIGWSEAADFGEWLVNNCSIPAVSGQCECDFSIESRQGVDFVRCVNCGDTYYKK